LTGTGYEEALHLKHITKTLLLTLLASLAGPCGAAHKLTVLGLFKDKAIVRIDGKQRVLAAGATSPEGVTLVSATSEEAIIEVDGEIRHLRLGTHIGTRYAKPKSGPAVQIWPDGGGMYSVGGSINGYPVQFLVDTGATLVAMNKNEARRLGIDYLVEGERGQSSTASGVVETYYLRLKKVKVGNVALTNVDAAVIDGDFPATVLLGNSFLNRLQMRRQGKMLELKKKY